SRLTLISGVVSTARTALIVLVRCSRVRLSIQNSHRIEPAVSPATIFFWKNTTSTINGRELATTPAAISPHGISYTKAPLRVATATVTVRDASAFMNVSASIYSFQHEMKTKTAAVATAGDANGNTIVK